MISTFFCEEIDQRLSILEYDGTKCSGRYRAVIDGDQATVLQLQSVDTKDVPLSHLVLCPGLNETEVLEILSQSPAASLACADFLIERVQQRIVYRSRDCRLLFSCEESGGLCRQCLQIRNNLRVQSDNEEENTDLKGHDAEDEKEKAVDLCDAVLKILKEEPLDDTLPSEHVEPPDGGQTKRKGATKVNKKKKPKKNYFCPQCPERFYYQLNMVKHASRQHGLFLPAPLKPGMTRCPFCAEIYNEDSPFFLAHLKYSHPQERDNEVCKDIISRITVAKYICSTCGKDFLSNRALEDHTVQVHSSHVNALPCEVCGKCFKSRGTLENHRRKVHENTPEDHLCVECGKIFNCKRNLVLHFERHHSNKEFVCRDCETVFRSRKDLREHIKRRHTVREKTEKCDQCEKDFYSTVALKKHISNVHEKLKPFYCEVCVFRCSRLSNLNVHRKTHSKTRISKAMLISMVESDEHPFYTKDDLLMLRKSVAD